MHLHHVFVSWRISFGLHRKCCSHKWNRFSNHLQARCYSMGLWSCLNFFVTKNVVPFKLLSFWLQFIYFRRNEWIRNCWRSAFVISFNVEFLIFDWTNIAEEWNDSFCKRNAVPYGRSWSLKHRYRLHYSNDFKFWIFLYFNILSRVFETKNHSEASEGLSYIHKFFNLKKFPWIR